MAIVKKAYRGTRSLYAKILAAGMFVVGFILLVFASSTRPQYFSNIYGGVVRADVPDGSSGGYSAGSSVGENGGGATGSGPGGGGDGTGADGAS